MAEPQAKRTLFPEEQERLHPLDDMNDEEPEMSDTDFEEETED